MKKVNLFLTSISTALALIPSLAKASDFVSPCPTGREKTTVYVKETHLNKAKQIYPSARVCYDDGLTTGVIQFRVQVARVNANQKQIVIKKLVSQGIPEHDTKYYPYYGTTEPKW